MKHTLLIASAIVLFSFASCNNEAGKTTTPTADSTAAKTESKSERNKKVIMACMEGINTHDLAKVIKDSSATFTEYQDGSTPPGNLDTTKHVLTMVFNCFPDMKAENSIFVADGNNVVVISDWIMTFKNDMGPVKATGKTVKYKDVDIFTLDDNGKITSHRNIYPTAAIMMQAGVDMSKMQAPDAKKK